ncbi:MAG: hypothetical protein NTW87_24370 [Planctomycetota bacterium]|nr:hypothetical protein [Planctomycetota bacterium]
MVAQDSKSVENPHFICHVALALEDTTVSSSDAAVNVAHMKPPHRSRGRMPIHAVGSVPLTAGERNSVGLFIGEVDQEQKAEQKRLELLGDLNILDKMLCGYVIRPHTDEVEIKSQDGTLMYRRFSCIGYVLEAYGEQGAGIILLDTREDSLPEVEEELLRLAYPPLEQMQNDPDYRARLASRGLDGAGPWRVVLPGYVLHALGRSENEIRRSAYRAATGDGAFPRRTTP